MAVTVQACLYVGMAEKNEKKSWIVFAPTQEIVGEMSLNFSTSPNPQ